MEGWEEPLHPGSQWRRYPTISHIATQIGTFAPLPNTSGRVFDAESPDLQGFRLIWAPGTRTGGMHGSVQNGPPHRPSAPPGGPRRAVWWGVVGGAVDRWRR